MTAPWYMYPIGLIVAAPVFALLFVFLFLLVRALWYAIVAPEEQVLFGRPRSAFMKWGFPAKH